MTSKRLGISFVIVALFALWSLAGIGMNSGLSSDSGDLLGVGMAYAGDPDDIDGAGNGGDPEADPPVKNPDPPESEDLDAVVQTLNTLASLLIWAF